MEEDIAAKILRYLKRNRVSSTEVADCLGKSGALRGVSAVNSGMYCVGRLRYIYGHSDSNWTIHEQARRIEEGEIAFIDGIGICDRSLIGELVCKYIVYYRMAAGVVSPGLFRDANDLIKNRYPVWCAGFNPVGCFNHNVEETPEISAVVAERRAMYDGAFAVCDDTGVVVIPRSELTADFYDRLERIEQQEDIWFNCIDFKKWDTFETVCLKRYLEE